MSTSGVTQPLGRRPLCVLHTSFHPPRPCRCPQNNCALMGEREGGGVCACERVRASVFMCARKRVVRGITVRRERTEGLSWEMGHLLTEEIISSDGWPPRSNSKSAYDGMLGVNTGGSDGQYTTAEMLSKHVQFSLFFVFFTASAFQVCIDGKYSVTK